MTEETKYEPTKESEEDTIDSECANESIPLGELEREVTNSNPNSGLFGFVSGAAITGLLSFGISFYNQEPVKELNMIPDVNLTEPGYITPNNIRIQMNDSNFNNLEETYFLHNEDKKWVPYLLKYGEKGIPEIVPYEIKEWPEENESN